MKITIITISNTLHFHNQIFSLHTNNIFPILFILILSICATPPLHVALDPLLDPSSLVNTSLYSTPFVPVSTKTLPTVTHIPILSGRTDFGAWNDGVRTLLLHLGYLGHVSDPPPAGFTPLPDRVPTYPPPLSDPPFLAELSAHKIWWERDNVASHVLLSRLSSVFRSLLPYDDGDSVSPCTSRVIYEILRETY